jgi:hypothetical protein
MPGPIDVREIMRQIHERVYQPSTWRRPRVSSQPQSLGLGELKRSVHRLRIRQDLIHALRLIDVPPPSPPTLRGRIGDLLVRAVRRSLFWYTARLRAFHAALFESLDMQAAAIRTLIEAVAGQRKALEDLENRIQDMSARLAHIERALDTAVGNQAEPDRPAGASSAS